MWSLCSVVFHTFTLQLPIQTLHSVAPEVQVSVSSLENCQNFSKTSTPLVTFHEVKATQRRIYIAKFWTRPPPIFFIFIRVAVNFGQIIGWRPLFGLWSPLGNVGSAVSSFTVPFIVWLIAGLWHKCSRFKTPKIADHFLHIATCNKSLQIFFMKNINSPPPPPPFEAGWKFWNRFAIWEKWSLALISMKVWVIFVVRWLINLTGKFFKNSYRYFWMMWPQTTAAKFQWYVVKN